MSRQARKEKSALEAKVREHLATNPVFRSEFREWLEAEKEIHVRNLIVENNEVTRGKIQMLDEMRESFQIGE
jgi:enhancing lycopene biosynthesis protein 2